MPALTLDAMRILIVEDHADLATTVGAYLEAAGHACDYAPDGPRAVRLAEQQAYDAIVLDRMLPGLDGLSVCQKLRAGAHPAVPILMLTAMDETEERLQGFDAGADDYMAKPFALAELRARLEALHKRARRAVGQAPLRAGPLEFDPRTQKVSRDGRALELAPALRKLLEYLLRQDGRVVPKAELEALLWGDSVPDGDVLRAHIHNLRRVIDKPFEAKLLHTVAGTGYRLAVDP